MPRAALHAPPQRAGGPPKGGRRRGSAAARLRQPTVPLEGWTNPVLLPQLWTLQVGHPRRQRLALKLLMPSVPMLLALLAPLSKPGLLLAMTPRLLQIRMQNSPALTLAPRPQMPCSQQPPRSFHQPLPAALRFGDQAGEGRQEVACPPVPRTCSRRQPPCVAAARAAAARAAATLPDGSPRLRQPGLQLLPRAPPALSRRRYRGRVPRRLQMATQLAPVRVPRTPRQARSMPPLIIPPILRITVLLQALATGGTTALRGTRQRARRPQPRGSQAMRFAGRSQRTGQTHLLTPTLLRRRYWKIPRRVLLLVLRRCRLRHLGGALMWTPARCLQWPSNRSTMQTPHHPPRLPPPLLHFRPPPPLLSRVITTLPPRMRPLPPLLPRCRRTMQLPLWVQLLPGRYRGSALTRWL